MWRHICTIKQSSGADGNSIGLRLMIGEPSGDQIGMQSKNRLEKMKNVNKEYVCVYITIILFLCYITLLHSSDDPKGI